MPCVEHPNIVLILSDEQHLDTVGCYGGPPVRTPHTDRLATEGTRFANAYCCSAICSPSRAALFTGLLPHRFGEVKNDLTIPRNTPNLAVILRSRGYRLGYAGKWHVDTETVPSTHGFEGKDFPGYGYTYPLAQSVIEGYPCPSGGSEIDPKDLVRNENHYYEYLAENGYDIPMVSNAAPTWMPERQKTIYPPLQGRLDGPVETSLPYFVAEEGVRLIRQFCKRRRKDGLPFFLWMNFWGPHNPCFIPEPYYSMYNPDDIPQPPSAEDPFTGKPCAHEQMSKYWGVYGAPWTFWQKHLAAYLGYCTLIDDQVGRIYSTLKEMGELDNTIIIFGTDHGDMLGRHQLLDKGPFCYDDIYHIPLIVRGPGVRTDVCDEFVYLHDLFPTIMDTAGAQIPSCDAASLMPLLTGNQGWTSRDAVFGESDFYIPICGATLRVIRTRTHKFVLNMSETCELYDLVNDPHEMHNVVDDPAYVDVKENLKAQLLTHLKETGDSAVFS